MAEKDLIVDTTNFSQFYPDLYDVSFEYVDGSQGGLMLSGAETVDELTAKEIIRVPLFPLTDEQIRTVLEVVIPQPIHTVHYYSPYLGERTIPMIRSVQHARYRGKGLNGADYWTGIEVVFREKG